MSKPNTIRIDEVEYVRVDTLPGKAVVGSRGPLTLVRSYAAGVYIGELVSRTGDEVLLANARLIHTWKGAKTTLEIATLGVANGSNLSEKVPEVTILGVIALLPVSTKAAATLGF